MITSRSGPLTAATSLALLVLVPLVAADEPPGVLWETVSQAAMEGMPMQMPAQTLKVCAAKQWTHPPPGGDRSCTSSNFRTVGSKATWTVQCTGRMNMTGVGEMAFSGTDSYTGSVKFTSPEVNMTVKLSGRRIGTCDSPQ